MNNNYIKELLFNLKTLKNDSNNNYYNQVVINYCESIYLDNKLSKNTRSVYVSKLFTIIRTEQIDKEFNLNLDYIKKHIKK